MERALREVGYAEEDVERMMAELIGAFDRSKEEGQAQWMKTRKAVLRRRAEAEAYAKAAETVKSYRNGGNELRPWSLNGLREITVRTNTMMRVK